MAASNIMAREKIQYPKNLLYKLDTSLRFNILKFESMA